MDRIALRLYSPNSDPVYFTEPYVVQGTPSIPAPVPGRRKLEQRQAYGSIAAARQLPALEIQIPADLYAAMLAECEREAQLKERTV